MSAGFLETYETYRSKLIGIAYRITGSVSESEDIAHETFIRWLDADHKTIELPYYWLVTVATRLALDHLKSARVKRQCYIGPWLPEPFIEDKDAPEHEHELDESVTMALLVVLEKLSPAERATFILHDLFHFSFEEIAGILEKTAASCRKLASRARKKVKTNQTQSRPTTEEQRAVISAFFNAIKHGNVENLVALLKDNVTFHADGGGKAVAALGILQGDGAIAKFLVDHITEDFSNSNAQASSVWFNGSPGIVITAHGHTISAFNLELDEGKIKTIHALRNPDKLKFFSDSKSVD